MATLVASATSLIVALALKLLRSVGYSSQGVDVVVGKASDFGRSAVGDEGLHQALLTQRLQSEGVDGAEFGCG